MQEALKCLGAQEALVVMQHSSNTRIKLADKKKQTPLLIFK